MRKSKYSDDPKERNRLKMLAWRAKNPGYTTLNIKENRRRWKESGKPKERMRRHKGLLLEVFGGRCQCCGGEFHQAEFDFHHLDKETKERPLQPDRGWKTLAIEAAKCVMLCANCHRLYHYFERNPTCETLQTHSLLPALKSLHEGLIQGPSLTELLKAGTKLSIA